MGEEEGKGAKGHLRVILVAIKGSAHFCFICWASSLLTGVLFRKGDMSPVIINGWKAERFSLSSTNWL